MSRIYSNFKKDLLQKVKQQAKSDSQELNFILRKFKYFDINKNGDCDYNTFSKVIARIGVFISSKEEEYEIYTEILETQKNEGIVDSKSKNINYNEFSTQILEKNFRNKSNALRVKSEYRSSKRNESSKGMIQYKNKNRSKNINEREYNNAVVMVRNAIFEINLLHILNHLNNEIQNNYGNRKVKYPSLLKYFLSIGLGYKFEVIFFINFKFFRKTF